MHRRFSSLMGTLRFVTRHPLNRGARGRAIGRFALWQVVSRVRRGPSVVDWVNGSRFLARTGETGLTGNIYTGLYDFAEMGFLLHVLREGDLFVDVGANAGAYTILACAGVGARGYAFEPVAAAYERLVENVRINHVEGRVTCVNKGVGAIEGRMDFTSGRDSVNHVLASGERPADVTSADVCTLDGALKGEAPAMMKIDVEGFEWSVLEGAREALTSPRLHSVLLELNGSGRRYGFDEARIPDLMESVGFGACSYDPMSRSLTAVDPAASATGNVLFVRDAERVRNLVQHAPRIRLRGKTLL